MISKASTVATISANGHASIVETDDDGSIVRSVVVLNTDGSAGIHQVIGDMLDSESVGVFTFSNGVLEKVGYNAAGINV